MVRQGSQEPRLRFGKAEGEVWVEVAFLADPDDDEPEEGWIAAARVRLERGTPIIAELRVFPDTGARRRAAGEWRVPPIQTGEWVEPETIPTGGMTPALLRLIPLGKIMRAAREQMDLTMAGRVARKRLSEPTLTPPPRPRQDPLFLARLAVRYADISRVGTTAPVRRLAVELGRDSAEVREWLRAARNQGLLTSRSRGAKGGEPTPKARRLVARAERM